MCNADQALLEIYEPVVAEIKRLGRRWHYSTRNSGSLPSSVLLTMKYVILWLKVMRLQSVTGEPWQSKRR
jgi:hypothetical protein